MPLVRADPATWAISTVVIIQGFTNLEAVLSSEDLDRDGGRENFLRRWHEWF